MTINDAMILTLALGTGLLLGVFFFGGLWWTTKKGVVSKSPALWFFGSFVVRLSITLLGIYYISQNHWERLLICLLGFIIARTLIIRHTKIPTLDKIRNKGGEP